MQGIRNNIAAFETTCPEISGVKNLLMQVSSEDNEDISLAQILQEIRDDLSPEALYSKNALTGPNTLHRYLRNLLTVLGVGYTQHPECNSINWGLVAQLFEDEEDRENCDVYLRAWRSRDGTGTNNSSGTNQSQNQNQSSAAKIGQAMSTHFKNDENKFEGRLGESFADTVMTYSEV